MSTLDSFDPFSLEFVQQQRFGIVMGFSAIIVVAVARRIVVCGKIEEENRKIVGYLLNVHCTQKHSKSA